MIEKIKQFYYLLDKQAKLGIPFLILAYIFSSFLDVIGIGSVGLFLGLLANPDLVAQKYPQLGSFLAGISEKKLILSCGTFIVIAFILKAILTIIIQTQVMYFCKAYSVRLKMRLMHAYQHAPYLFYLDKNSAHLLSRVQNSADFYVNMLVSILNFTSNILIAIGVLFFLCILHPVITSLLILMLVLLGFGYDFFAKKKIKNMANISAKAVGEIIKSIQHGLHGLIEIRVLNKENYFINLLKNVAQQYAKSTGLLASIQQVPRNLLENMIAIFMVALSIGGLLAGYNAGSIVAMVGIFAAAGARLLPTFNQIMATSHDVRAYYPHLCYVYDDLKELEATSMISDAVAQDHKLPFATISLQNIYYQYPDTDQYALQDISFHIKKGQSIGLIGTSGAGKSTLVNLILGFLSPLRGSLLVDMKPIANTRAWLSNFAYIPQTIFLLDDTLRNNIALGIESDKIDETKLRDALQMAQLTEVVAQLPNGVNTIIGEAGIRLSGGQRQRVALARAFYHEREIIVMDEATSSLDNETEKEIINTIKRFKGNKTLIVIAHRLTTVEHCDVLYKLQHGQLIAQGSYHEVINA